MNPQQNMNEQLVEALIERLGDQMGAFHLPPPVYLTMQAEVLEIDVESGRLKVKFPVLEAYLNPYGSMQGGMVGAAIDNALGPLSMLVAPPNVTRRMELKFSRPVTMDLIEFIVDARFIDQEGRTLRFTADARDLDGALLARASATHWIIS
jgi:acyl-coenzyme A thioesterase PaaI-like protein